MKKSLFLFFISVSLLFYQCGTETVDQVESELSHFSNQHFGGIQIGDSLHVILSLTNDSVVQKGGDLLITKLIKGDKVEKREVHITMDEGKAFEITVDMFLKHDSIVEGYFFHCKEKLEEVYGPSDVDNGYATWQTPSIHKKVIEIELFDESIDYDIAMVSVNFFEDHDKSFYAE